MKKFKNEEFVDFSRPSIRRKQEKALEALRGQFAMEYPLVIGGRRVTAEEQLKSYNPARPSEVVGTFQKGTVAHAEEAIRTAHSVFGTWRNVPPAKRASYLFKAARIMRKRRFELNAAVITEVGKPWNEADADVAEAIDFLEYYGREMLRYGKDHPVVKRPGEKGRLVYLPLGVGVVIPPWNFPFAILAGMSSAAIVTGNTVVLKPSSDSPLIGWKFMEIMEEAGLPAGVLNFVTGPGGSMGDSLVAHPLTRFVSFTGSKEVGIHIYELAARVQPGQVWLKRVVAEMGGKDSIIVDDGVDLEEASTGVVQSAFGFQGQKCSACSRAIVHENVYNEFVSLVAMKTAALTMGDPASPDVAMGPVINARARDTIMGYIEKALNEGGRTVAGGVAGDVDGYFIRPTVIADVTPKATIAQEEIFGPVLAIIKAKDFDEAMQIANNTEYGLTGAVYSRNRKHLKRAEEEFFVGNLYINRGCTGAFVGAHPFGGFNMSGTDSKAGGRDYLLLFLQAKSIAVDTRKRK
ncbi:MAG: L-glutamate gamma-semialdehyde dehydrogenase [Ignavibacteria bacterium]|nr:L-glutamate gamma-semialdehyde dehydrogenase [Ignavibacteria bacterium]